MTRVKICGVTLPDDAAAASAAGADLIGLNFWPRSKRHVDPARAPTLATVARAAGRAKIAGVFVDESPDEIARIARAVALDVIQLHGDESPAEVARVAALARLPVWKALAADDEELHDRMAQDPADAILLDTPTPGRGGGGVPFDWAIARDLRRRYPARVLVLAGGLRPDNVAAAITAVAPWAVDVASGVEAAPGIKDPAKVAALIAAVRAAG